MIFVLEGLDRVGKSTLGQHLVTILGWPLLSLPRPYNTDKNEWDRGKKDFEAIITDHQDPCIVDRFAYSEIVYSEVYNRPCDREWYINKLQEHHDKLRVIYVYESYDILIQRWLQEQLQVLYIFPLQATYQVLFQQLGLVDLIDIYRLSSRDELRIPWLVEWMQRETGKLI